MDPSADAPNKARSCVETFTSDQKSKSTLRLNMQVRNLGQECNEKYKTLKEYATRAKTLSIFRRKSTLQLNQDTACTQSEQQQFFGINGLKYLRFRKPLTKNTRQCFDFDLHLKANKQELERIQQEIKSLEEELQNTYVHLPSSKKISSTELQEDTLQSTSLPPQIEPSSSDDEIGSLEEQLHRLAKQHEEDMRRLELSYRQSAMQSLIKSTNELNKTILEASNSTNYTSRLKTSKKWRSRLMPNLKKKKYEEIETTKVVGLTGVIETDFVAIHNRIVDVKVPNDEIAIYPVEDKSQQLLESDKLSLYSIDEEGNTNISEKKDKFSESLSDVDITLLETNQSYFSSEHAHERISKVCSHFFQLNKTTLKPKSKRNEYITPNLFEDELMLTSDSRELHGSFETLNNKKEEDEIKLSFTPHFMDRNRYLLGLQQLQTETLQRTSLQNDQIRIQVGEPDDENDCNSEYKKKYPTSKNEVEQISNNTEVSDLIEDKNLLASARDPSQVSESIQIKSNQTPKTSENDYLENFQNSFETRNLKIDFVNFSSYLSRTGTNILSKCTSKLKGTANKKKLLSNLHTTILNYTTSIAGFRNTLNKSPNRQHSLSNLSTEEIELQELNKSNKTSSYAEFQNKVNKRLEEITNQNGFRKPPSFEVNLKGNVDEHQEKEQETSPNFSISKIKKIFSILGNLSKGSKTITKETEVTSKESIGDIVGELMDMLQDITESLSETKKIREDIAFESKKTDLTIKPLKVHRNLTEKKIQSSRRRKEKSQDLENVTKHGCTIETTAIVHRSLDSDSN